MRNQKNENYDSLLDSICTALSALVSTYLPGDNIVLNTIVSNAIGNILRRLYIMVKLSGYTPRMPSFLRGKEISFTICKKDKFFDSLKKWIIDNHLDKIDSWTISNNTDDAKKKENDENKSKNKMSSLNQEILKPQSCFPRSLTSFIREDIKNGEGETIDTMVISLNEETFNIVSTKGVLDNIIAFLVRIKDNSENNKEHPNFIVISKPKRKNDDNDNSIIYKQFLRWLKKKYPNNFDAGNMFIGENGVDFLPTKTKSAIDVAVGEEIIKIWMVDDSVFLWSEHLDVYQLCQFVNKKINVADERAKGVLRIHTTIKKKNDDSTIAWKTESATTTKTLKNTIFSQKINEELIDDLKMFMDMEEWYNKKGIVYKRGYLLHGPPGTGKTSIIKAFANTYSIDVFVVDLGVVKKNSDLVNLISNIKRIKNGKYHILSFEDIDNSRFFDNCAESGLTIQCLLNVIDGVSENYGQIMIWTANDIYEIKRNKALIRPGRIDKICQIDFCTQDQLLNMLSLLYDDPIDIGDFVIKDRVSPASIIQEFMKYPRDINGLLNSICITKDEYDKMEEESQEDYDYSAPTRRSTVLQRLKQQKRNKMKLINNYKNQLAPLNDYDRRLIELKLEKEEKLLEKKNEQIESRIEREKLIKKKNDEKRRLEAKRRRESVQEIRDNSVEEIEQKAVDQNYEDDGVEDEGEIHPISFVRKGSPIKKCSSSKKRKTSR